MLVVSGDKHAIFLKILKIKRLYFIVYENVPICRKSDDIEDDILKFYCKLWWSTNGTKNWKIRKQLKPHLKLVTTGNVWFDIFRRCEEGTT